MKGLNYKTFLYYQDFFNYPLWSANSIQISPFTSLQPDFTGTVDNFSGDVDASINFAQYGCTSVNTNGFEYFNVSLDGYLFTGNHPGIYQFVFHHDNINNDDITYFYFGDTALNPTLTNVDHITRYDSGVLNTFTTAELKENSYYPILMYYGQSFGGRYLTLGLLSPGSLTIDYSPNEFQTVVPRVPVSSSLFTPNHYEALRIAKRCSQNGKHKR